MIFLPFLSSSQCLAPLATELLALYHGIRKEGEHHESANEQHEQGIVEVLLEDVEGLRGRHLGEEDVETDRDDQRGPTARALLSTVRERLFTTKERLRRPARADQPIRSGLRSEAQRSDPRRKHPAE